MEGLEYVIVFAVALLATIALVPLAKKMAVRLDAIDYPSSRRVNQKPIPRIGGLAILGGIGCGFIVLLIGMYFWNWRSPFTGPASMGINYLGVLLGTLVIFGVGFIDDVINLKPYQKLIGQIIAASIVAASGLLLSSIHNPIGTGFINFGWFAYPLTIFYLVAFANVINLIDGLDGLAAGICAICSFTIFIFAIMTNRFDAAIFCIGITGACIGFLRYNFNPASIFMGDSGALFLGFALGVVSLLSIARSALFVSLLVPIIAAGIPVLDTFFAIVRRLREHKRIDAADKGHIHHRLLQAGFSQRKTVLIMYAWTAALALCSIAIAGFSGLWRWIPIVIAGLLTGYVVVRLHLLDPVLIHHYNPRKSKGNKGPSSDKSVGEGNASDQNSHQSPDQSLN